MKRMAFFIMMLHALATNSPAQNATAAPTGGSNMNPAIGVVGNFSYTNWLNKPQDVADGESKNGFTFEEAELSFRMTLDPYARADFFIAVVPPEEAVELEEGYLTLLGLPHSLQLKVGKFRSAFGKLNTIHPPETEFTDVPLILTRFFGDEGLAETGVSVSVLVPNPWDQYLEARAEVTNGDNDISFNGHATDDYAFLGHLKSFFELGENASFELGLSGLSGVNDANGKRRTNLSGVNFIYRWKPLRRGLYKSVTLWAEALQSRREMAVGNTITSVGYFGFVQYQLSRRWFAGARYDYAEMPADDTTGEKAYSGILSFCPSEFQRLKLQFRQTHQPGGESDSGLFFQWTFVIGAHGAHPF